MDDGDRGQRVTENFRTWALNMQLQRSKNSGDALRQCIECGETIAEARRLVQPGCMRCVDCQESYEKRK